MGSGEIGDRLALPAYLEPTIGGTMRTALRATAAAAARLPALAGAGLGAGLGAVVTVLTLNNTRNVSSGRVTPTGTSGCGFLNNVVQESSTTRLLSEIGGLSTTLGTGLRIVANFSEPAGNAARIDALQLQLFGGNGAVLCTGHLDAPRTFASSQMGVRNVGFSFGPTAAAAATCQGIVDRLASLENVRSASAPR